MHVRLLAAAVGAVTGSTFTLTTGTDTIIGTSGNDTITGTSSTLAAADIVLDSTTTDSDTLNLTLTANNAAATITGIENINVNWDAFGTAGIVATNISGATITGTSSKVGFLGTMTITDAGSNTIVAGTGMVGTLTVNGGKAAVVTGGTATKIVVDGVAADADAVSATVTAGTATTSVTVGTTQAFKTNTIDAGTATTIAIADQGTTSTTSLTVGKSATVTNTGTGTLALIAGATGVTTTLSTVGKSLDVQGAQSTTLKAASANLTAETVTNSLTAGTLTVAINGAIGADANLSAVAADLFTITTAFGADAAVAVASGSSISTTVNMGNGEFGVLIADDSSADTLTITSTFATQTIIQADGTDATLGDIETLTIVAAATAVTGTDMTIVGIEAGANKVVLTGTNDVVVTNIIAKTFDASGLTGDLTATSTTDAVFTVSGATGANTIVFAGTTVDASYTGQNGDDTVTFVNSTGNATAVLGNGANKVTASSGTTGSLVVIGGDGVDTVVAATAGTGAGQVNLTLGGGADVATVTGAGANDNVAADLGAGNDKFTVGAATTANDVMTIDGGADTDTLNIAGLDVSAGTWTLSNTEILLVSTANTAKVDASLLTGKTIELNGTGAVTSGVFTDRLDVAVATAGTYDLSGVTMGAGLTVGAGGLDITGSGTADNLTGSAGDDVIIGAGGADTLNGSAGNDIYSYVATADLFSSNAVVDNIADSTGTDSIAINNNAGATFTIAAADSFASRITGVEKIVAQGASDQIITITLNNDAREAGIATVDLSLDTDATSNNVISAAAETSTTLGFTLKGSAGVDTITGGAAADSITSGLGADVIAGGSGADTFVYTTATSSNATSAAQLDTISDLVLNGSSGDLFDFTLTGVLTVATSVGGATVAASDTTAELEGLFNSATGTAGTLFTGVGAATALLVTNTDASKMLVVDVDGDGSFTVADVAIIITGVTATSFTTACFV